MIQKVSYLEDAWKNVEGHKREFVSQVLNDTKSIDENVKHRCSKEIDQKDWKAFIEYRLEEDTLENCRKNTENCSKQLYTRIGGSKSMARRREEEVRRHGRHISRGEMLTMVHRRNDGSYIYDDARATGEAIIDIKSRDKSAKELFQNDSLAQVLEKEHSGRVCGVGPRLCLTKLCGSTSHQSSYAVQIEEYQKKIVELKAEASEEKKKRQAMENILRFLIER
ncbi:hypothetical protein PIB30_035156 [Stylosanthes scabra]|uniref:Uncharacterized protein n=1 Tax=Stylosanthes scabra TaxID=79078 RepID=A0ABU6WBA6_9FABA|nr:hypothetical protein [Stylosanthes scabra]